MEKLSQNTIIHDGVQSYTLLEYIGSGSYGEVWRARNNANGNEVAIKFYIMLDDKGREEFMSEYEIAYGLTHKNLLTASYIGTWENRPFLVMRYCPKGSSVRLIGQLMPNNENEKILWRFIHDVASGLAYLHSVEPDPIVHQDIKPDNILQDSDGGFVITDFGISKKIRSTMRSQSTRAVKAGAVAYMGPERFSSQPTPIMASDIWSLGASIYELATGELPFYGQGGNMLRNGADMPEINGWSEDLKNIIYSCLAKEPWDRMKAFELAEYAQTKLNEITGDSEFNPRKTLRKNSNDVNTGGKVQEKPNVEIKQDTSSKPRKRAWIWSSVSLVILFFVVFFATANRREARSYISEYQSLVSKCSNNITKGSNSDYILLLDAASQIEKISEYENKYADILPKIYNQYDELNNQLKTKRMEACDAWVKAAKKQKKLGEINKAIDYYSLANKLNPSSEPLPDFISLAQSMGYMKIKDIEFRNCDDDKEISAWGEPIKSSDSRWIEARIKYDGILDESKSLDLTIKIFDPYGDLYSGKKSPKGCTFINEDCTVAPGEDNYLTLYGYGNATSYSFWAGTFRYEVWYDGNKLFSKKIQFK